MQTERLEHEGFTLRLEHGFGRDEARAVIERVLATSGDRVHFLMDRPAGGLDEINQDGGLARVFVKAEFRRPHQPLAKRLRRSRSLIEGRGYRFFHAAGLPVPRVLMFGEQSRLRPRSGSVIATEMVRHRNARFTYGEASDDAVRGALAARLADTLAWVHSAGFVHGDAVLRNFVATPDTVWIVDVPRWGRVSADGIVKDIGHMVGSTQKLDRDDVVPGGIMLDAYAAAAGRREVALPGGWREAALECARGYLGWLEQRDRTRAERHARKANNKLRPGERGTTP